MAWEDDDPDEVTSGLAVARALSGTEEEVPEDDGPDMGATKAASSRPADESTTAQDIASEQPASREEQPADVESEAPEEETAAAVAGPSSTITAPKRPTMQPLSNAPVEAAQELANAKTDFGSRVASGAYKPSVWRRIGAGVAGGMVGFGTRNADEGLRVGEGVTSAPLDRARQAEAAKESGIQSRIDAGNVDNQRTQQQNATALQEYGLDERDMHNQGYVAGQKGIAEDRASRAQDRDNAITQFTPTDPNNPYAGGTGVTAAGKKVENVAPPDKWMQEWVKTPQGKAAVLAMDVDARKKVAPGIGLKPGTADYREFTATGKMSRAASVHIPSETQERYNDWKTQYHKDNGRDPSAAEINAYGHVQSGAMSKNLGDRIESQKQTALNKLQQDLQSGAVSKDDYMNEWQTIQDDYEQRLTDATGQDIPHVTIKDNVDPETLAWHGKAPAQSKTGPQPVQQQQPKPGATPATNGAAQDTVGPQTFQFKGQTVSKGQKVMVNGQPKTIVGFNPQTGKLKVQ